MTPEQAREIVDAARFLYDRGWCWATSGNFSLRLDAERVAITASGKDKGSLSADDVLVVDLDGTPLTDGKPSAETLLHCRLYQRFGEIGAVLHVHTVNATVLSRLAGDALRLEGYEMQKAFRGVTTHERDVIVPVVDNAQDMEVLAAEVDARLDDAVPGYLIRGHGLYAWGADLAEAKRHVEAFEFLFTCEIESRRLAP